MKKIIKYIIIGALVVFVVRCSNHVRQEQIRLEQEEQQTIKDIKHLQNQQKQLIDVIKKGTK